MLDGLAEGVDSCDGIAVGVVVGAATEEGAADGIVDALNTHGGPADEHGTFARRVTPKQQAPPPGPREPQETPPQEPQDLGQQISAARIPVAHVGSAGAGDGIVTGVDEVIIHGGEEVEHETAAALMREVQQRSAIPERPQVRPPHTPQVAAQQTLPDCLPDEQEPDWRCNERRVGDAEACSARERRRKRRAGRRMVKGCG